MPSQTVDAKQKSPTISISLKVLGGTSTAAKISETVLHFCNPSDAAPTTSGIYFSNDNEEISFNNAA
jgi:hypothetical protein